MKNKAKKNYISVIDNKLAVLIKREEAGGENKIYKC